MALTTNKLQTLKADILARAEPEFVAYREQGATGAMAEFYNRDASPAFLIWRRDVSGDDIGNAWVGTDIDGMSALNMQRLQLLLASSPSGVFDMTRADRRAGFENPFGTNVNNASRVAMRAAWRRNATNVERVFATGLGTEGSPGVAPADVRFVSADDISAALAS